MEGAPEWDDADNQLQDPEELKVLFTALDSYVSVAFSLMSSPSFQPTYNRPLDPYRPLLRRLPSHHLSAFPETTPASGHHTEAISR